MVDEAIKSHKLAYSLDAIRAAAENGEIIYASRKVNNDISNLGYTEDEVIRCIVGLCSKHYKETLTYRKSGKVDDVYIRNFVHADKIDPIYMKLRLLPEGLVQILRIGSFHR